MTSILVAMLIVLAIAAGTLGLVLVGMQGRGKRRAPRLAHTMARAARHLNGDGQPPKRFVKLIEHSLSR